MPSPDQGAHHAQGTLDLAGRVQHAHLEHTRPPLAHPHAQTVAPARTRRRMLRCSARSVVPIRTQTRLAPSALAMQASREGLLKVSELLAYVYSWSAAFWMSWGMFFDPGTQTGLTVDNDLSAKLVAVLFSISGFLFNLAFLGIVIDLIRDKLNRYEKVYSRIVKTDHTVVLGWTTRSIFLLKVLIFLISYYQPSYIVRSAIILKT